MPDLRREQLAALEGLISPEVGERLASLAMRVPSEHAIVEIGSYRGKSTCYLAAGARTGNGAHVFAIDPWDSKGNATGRFGFANPATRYAFSAQVESMELGGSITPLRAFSAEIAPHWLKPIGLLYIDGSHTERDVARDWELWSPHLAPKCMVAFDDYRTERNPGVEAVVDVRLRKLPGFTWAEGPVPLIVGFRQ